MSKACRYRKQKRNLKPQIVVPPPAHCMPAFWILSNQYIYRGYPKPFKSFERTENLETSHLEPILPIIEGTLDVKDKDTAVKLTTHCAGFLDVLSFTNPFKGQLTPHTSIQYSTGQPRTFLKANLVGSNSQCRLSPLILVPMLL